MRLAWHHFIFDLPDDWEVTRYSTAVPCGRFEFASREGSLGRLSWETTQRFPDEQRILTEYHRRYLRQSDKAEFQGFSGIQTERVGPFLVGYRHTGEPCQAVAHLGDTGIVLLWVFPAYSDQRLKQIWLPILKSFRPNAGAWREWGCFGLQCRLPQGFDIERAACRPADAWIEFQHKNMHRIDVHRWGLPRELLRGRDLEGFFRHILRGSGARVLESRQETWRGLPSVRTSIETRGTLGMDRLYASCWRGEGRIWHDAAAKRLYAYAQAAPRKVILVSETEMFPL